MSKITIKVVDAERYDGDFPPDKLIDFKNWLDMKIAEIPPEHRDAADIEISSSTYYDSTTATICIFYMRERTEDEEAAYAEDIARRTAINTERERQEFERLKAKFGQ